MSDYGTQIAEKMIKASKKPKPRATAYLPPPHLTESEEKLLTPKKKKYKKVYRKGGALRSALKKLAGRRVGKIPRIKFKKGKQIRVKIKPVQFIR